VSRHWLVLFGLTAQLLTGRAGAEPSAADKEKARALMSEGRTLRDQGDLGAALKSFEAADAVMQVTTTAFEIGRTQEMMGRLVQARETMQRIVAIPLTASDPAPFQAARSKAETLLADLDARIPTLSFAITVSPGAAPPEVTVDGVRVAPNALQSQFRVDPGIHQVVSRLGQQRSSQSITVQERDRKKVVIDFDSAVAANRETGIRAPSPAADQDAASPWRTVGYAGLAIGGTGIVVGAIAGLVALSNKNLAEAGCEGGRCPPKTWDALDRAESFATVSTVGFAVGAAAIGVGVVGFVLQRPAKDAAAGTALRVNASIGAGRVNFAATF